LKKNKAMKKLIFISIIVALCLFLFQQCKKERNKNLGTIYLTEQEKSIIPYHGGEHLVFKDSLGDSAIINVAPPVDTFIKRNKSNTDNYYLTEVNLVRPFIILLGYFPTQTGSGSDLILSIVNFHFDNHPEIHLDFSGDWSYNSGKLYYTTYGSWGWCGIKYMDSVTIVNKKFYSIYELSGYPISDGYPEMYKNIYYSVQQGIVGIKTMDGYGAFRRWYLK